ncbi:MAG: HD domain-containing protein [Lentisphaeria bacterium]|nr:HD domain-containing protein [Lentisphaeria bacterium]
MPSLKSICIPAAPPVDVTDFLPLIDHPLFQQLRYRKQLGVNELVFPGALHSRFEHALGVLSLTQRLCRFHSFTREEQHLLQGFALLHDLGHGPFSHQIEPVLAQNHHQIGQKRIEEMRKTLTECGLAPEELCDMLRGNHPLACWISDRNLGTDKLDYLHRDALHIGFQGTPDLEKIQFYTEMTPEGLAIREKLIEDAKQLQKFYSYLHQHGYLNKTALAVQRILQRAVQEELLLTGSDGAKLWDMIDRQLLSWLENARSPLSRDLAGRLETRQIHRTILSVKPAGYAFVENSTGKELQVFEWSRAELSKFSHCHQDIKRLRKLEDELAEFCKLQPGELLCSVMPYFTKLIPKDLRVFTGNPDGNYWLLEQDKDHSRSLESDYLRTFAVRILVIPEKRSQLLPLAAEINTILKTHC